ncbi:MAG: radical SAM protein [Bacteroidetes bacterium]|nr:radical SAM protein [Bacteroidota bacterium]
MTILFDEIVFGPVKSRRFGVSLGMNLLPLHYKYCTFNCVYCECGWTFQSTSKKIQLPDRKQVFKALEARLRNMTEKEIQPDNITFAGNGEPTVHPDFHEIINDTLKLRDQFFPGTDITVLSNASQIHKKKVFDALNKIENNVLKLDSAFEETFQKINQPAPGLQLKSIVENLKKFDGNQIIQTLFIRGTYQGQIIDNTTDKEIEAWLSVLQDIRPKYVMIYPIERETPIDTLEKITKAELEHIARKVEKIGISIKVYD